jgi:ribose-phosphate pyrophosphokinase
MIEYILNNNLIRDFNKLTIVSPDANGVNRAKKFADILISKTSADIGLSLVIKERLGSFDSDKMELVGNVKGHDCIILDDIVDTSTTLISASEELYKNGAKNVYAFATHGVFSGSAIENLKKSNIKKIVVTNTIPINKEQINDKFIVLSSATLIAETIRRIYHNESISEVFL